VKITCGNPLKKKTDTTKNHAIMKACVKDEHILLFRGEKGKNVLSCEQEEQGSLTGGMAQKEKGEITIRR